jgi:TetR/AcrR family transcriptional regulator, tetracycline repressor protein
MTGAEYQETKDVAATTYTTAMEAPLRHAVRGSLNREVILAAAIEFVDESGLSALTMRALGRHLGVEAMALYRYVNGREDLLEGVVDRLVSELRVSSAGQDLGPVDGWQGYLQWLARAVRQTARMHPGIFPLMATRHPAAPWLRPPLRSLEVVEDFLDALISRGFSDDAAVAAYRSFSSFLLGHLLLEAAALGAQTSPAEEPLDEGGADVPNADAALDLQAFPHVSRLERLLSQDHADAEFEQSLEDLLDRLDRTVAQ